MISTYRPQADGIPLIDKAPDAVLDYPVDWSLWLGDTETITGHVTTVQDGIDKTAETASASSVTTWLSGGTIGSTYLVTTEITTSQARTDSRSFRVRVTQR